VEKELRVGAGASRGADSVIYLCQVVTAKAA